MLILSISTFLEKLLNKGYHQSMNLNLRASNVQCSPSYIVLGIDISISRGNKVGDNLEMAISGASDKRIT